MSMVNRNLKADSQESAGRPREQSSKPFEGQLVSITGQKLVMTNRKGKEYSHSLAEDAQLTCDGTACTAEALKVGSKIRVTTEQDDRDVVTCVEALDAQSEFAECSK
jgi:hypothetical protein